ncbi:MAG TPA: stage 0 sporulation family protein, partial [Clostridia bacterium]|nr:stage 0 sporulation family protein [Clostridia bacterium]
MAKRVVGVRFKKAGRMYYFDPGDLQITESDGVIVETSRGIEYGEVVLSAHNVEEDELVAPLKEVVRVATEEDSETNERNLQLEEEAFTVCQEKIEEHALDMKLVDVEYTFNGSKITFFFTSEGRVDFRELVKDLAHVFKTRIELRQIGVRDEAKMLGGLGSCGLPICCKTFLEDFQPVPIKMAKEQNLSLSPTKISGLCGRL